MSQEFDVTLGPEGTVAVPEAIREYLDIEPGDPLRFVVNDEGAVEIVNPRPAASDLVDPAFVDVLRDARTAAEGSVVMALLSRGIPVGVLQDVALGLLMALEQGTPGAPGLARDAADLLDERGWRGDADMAGLLRDRADGRDRGRPSVPVDVGFLASAFDDGDDMRAFVNATTGEVLFVNVYDMDPADRELLEEDDYLRVETTDSRERWLEMDTFAERQEPRVRRRLQAAIQGRGAFRRFRNLIYDVEDLGPAWHQFREEREMGRIVQWLMAEGLDIAPRTTGA